MYIRYMRSVTAIDPKWLVELRPDAFSMAASSVPPSSPSPGGVGGVPEKGGLSAAGQRWRPGLSTGPLRAAAGPNGPKRPAPRNFMVN